MNRWMIPTIAFVVAIGLLIPEASLATTNSLSQEEEASESMKDHPSWVSGLKTQHHLSDQHIEFMKGKGLSYPQMAIASRISEKSGKTVDDILEMRSQKKMSWDKIAETLEIDSEDSSSSIIAIRQEITDSMANQRKNAMND